MGTARHTRGRTMLLSAAGVSALVATTLIGATFSSDPAYAATTVNPMAAAGDFTVRTEGDASFGNSEIEGSVAVGGDYGFVDNFPLMHSSGLTPPDYDIAEIDGDPTRLLVRGTFDDSTGTLSEVTSQGNVRDDQLGFAKIGNLAGLQVTSRADDKVWIADGPSGTQPGIFDPHQPYVADPDPATASRVQLSATGWDDYFDAIDNTDQTTTCLSELEQTTTIEQGSDANQYVIDITAGVTNVVTVTPDSPIFTNGARVALEGADLAADTTLVFRVTDAADATLDMPTFEAASDTSASEPNPVAPYTLWDLSSNAGSAVEVTGEKISGSIHAPGVDLTLDASSPVEGQIISETLVTGGGEIHHYLFAGTIDCDEQPTPTPTTTTPTQPTPTRPTSTAPTTPTTDASGPTSDAPSTDGTESTSDAPGGPSAGGPESGALPDTGAPTGLLAALAAGLALVIGGVALTRRRGAHE